MIMDNTFLIIGLGILVLFVFGYGELRKINIPGMRSAALVVPDNYPTLEAAYAAASEGQVITLRPGKYTLKEGLILDKNIIIRGETGKPEDVVVECRHSHVFTIRSGNPTLQCISIRNDGNVRADGVEYFAVLIEGGSPKLFRCDIVSEHSIGICVLGEETSTTSVLERCTVHSCGSVGILFTYFAQGTVRDCDIYENTGGGVLVGKGGNPTVRGCRIHDGKNAGIAVIENGLGQFTDCDIYENTKSGVYVEKGGDPTVQGCKIHDGKDAGIGVFENGLGQFTDCDIYGNRFMGVYVESGGNPTVRGCKIHDGKDGGIGVFENGKGTFIGNTLSNNLDNWLIFPNAEIVVREGNTPNQ